MRWIRNQGRSHWKSQGNNFRFLLHKYRLVLLWPFFALLIAAIGWSLLLSQLKEQKETLEQTALREAAVFANSYASQLTRTLEAIEQISLHVKYEWQLTNGRLRLEDARQEGLFRPGSSFFVFITDSAGRIVTSTFPISGAVDVEDRLYFLVQKVAETDGFYISAPAVGRASKRDVIFFSRRLEDQSGNFAGVVAISIGLSYFTSHYDTATYGKHGLLGMMGTDHIVRAVRMGDTVYAPGADVSIMSYVPRIDSPNGSTIFNGKEWFVDQRTRFIGWKALDKYPLVAIAGLDYQDTLAPYYANRATSIREGVLASAALLLFTLIAMALSARLVSKQHEHELSQATYRMATEGGNEGFYIVAPIHDGQQQLVDFRMCDCNQRGAELFRYRREELIGKTVSMLYEGACPERIISMLSKAISSGYFEGEWEVPNDSPFVARWVHIKAVHTGGNLAVTLRDISEAKQHVVELERRSNEDTLTGLPNRHSFQSYLPRALSHATANNAMLAVMFIDLDGFKVINDTMGHEAGDEVLQNAARRLKVAVRPHDYVARLGGDEFVVVLDNISNKEDAAHVAQRIQLAFQDAFRLPQGMHSVGTSIGISVFPLDGMDTVALLRNADIAMYAVKTSGKRNYRFYDEKLYETLRTRLSKEEELRYAIEHDQFVMYYQPRVDMASGTTSSMEALVRWAHPTRGLINPSDFIPLAEETGLILELGEMIIDKVCAQVGYWARRGQPLVPVSINVSSRQFNEVDVAKLFATSLAKHQVDPKLIEIELTESSMMGNTEEIAHSLAAIQKMGIKLLVDDFGTGYSSLSQLQQMDFDVLKVDRAFTSKLAQNEEGHIFFKAIITMAHALGMRVVAEGVENVEQIHILRDLGCDEIQGFYISEPLPPSARQPILPQWHFSAVV